MFEDRSKLQLPGFGPPWHIATGGGKELAVIGSIKSGAWRTRMVARCVSQILSGGLSQERQDLVLGQISCFSRKVRIFYA